MKARPPIPTLASGHRFQRHYGHETPLCINRWEWNTTFNRWSAFVTFYDGRQCWTYPE